MRLKDNLLVVVKLLIFIQLFSSCRYSKKEHPENEVEQPYNVLFISVDDLRTELNCYDAKHIKFPNIDKLANQGVRFSNITILILEKLKILNMTRSTLIR